MTEQIYTLSENGIIQNLTNRSEVHQKGILHLAVQCWIINEAGEILIQRRSLAKDKSAGKWDVSFGGHCSHTTQTNIQIANLIKEGNEELGLQISEQDLIKLGEIRYTSQQNKNKELLGVYLLKIKNNQQFIFKDKEVMDVMRININTLYNNMSNNPKNYANRLNSLILLKNYIKMYNTILN